MDEGSCEARRVVFITAAIVLRKGHVDGAERRQLERKVPGRDAGGA